MKKIPKGRNDSHETDYSEIDKYIVIGSNLCEGNVCPVHGPEFKKLNICVEINLDDERKEIPPDVIESYTWMPVVDGYPPDKTQLDLGTSIIHEAIKNNKRVYVHCRNGHGRSPTLVAAYLMKYKNMSSNEAQMYIKKKRPEIHIEESQKKALEEYTDK